MFMLRSTHEKMLARAEALQEVNHAVWRAHDQRVIEAERSISASLRAEIEAMRADYEFGKARREQNRRAEETRKIKRAAKRAGI